MLTFLIENIISEDIFLREDLSVAKILHSRIDDERKRMLKCQFLYGKHFHRNWQRYLIGSLIGLVVLALLIFGRLNLFALVNGTVVLISSGLAVYWRFSTEIFTKYSAFRLNFEVHNLIRSVREHSSLSRRIAKFNQNYENILRQHGLVNSEQSPYRFLWTSWQQLVDAARLEQVAVCKELLRNIQYLVKYGRVQEEFELCFLNHIQTIVVESLRMSELCDLFLLLQSNFFLVLVLSLCNRVNLQSDSTLKQLVLNLNCLIRDSNRKLNADYENMEMLSEPPALSTSSLPSSPSLQPPSFEPNTSLSAFLKKAIEWITERAPKIEGRTRKPGPIRFEEIKFRKLIFDLIVKFRVTHSVILNIEHFSKQTVNEKHGESSSSHFVNIEKNLALLNDLFSECQSLIRLLNTNSLKASKRNGSVRETEDNESQQCDSIDSHDVADAPSYNEPAEDQVYQVSPAQPPIGTRIRNREPDVSTVRQKEQVDFLTELTQVLKSRESEWQQREQAALERNAAPDEESTSETPSSELVDVDSMESVSQADEDLEEEIIKMIATNQAFSQILMANSRSVPVRDHEVYTYKRGVPAKSECDS